jgi:hypothetical protein
MRAHFHKLRAELRIASRVRVVNTHAGRKYNVRRSLAFPPCPFPGVNIDVPWEVPRSPRQNAEVLTCGFTREEILMGTAPFRRYA